MALDKLVDSAKLDAGLSDTAEVIRALLSYICDATMPALDWEVNPVTVVGGYYSGFAADIIDFANAHEPSGGGGLVVPNVEYKAGTFKLTSNRTSAYSITHGLGETPAHVIAFCVTSGANQYIKWSYSSSGYGYSNAGSGANANKYRCTMDATKITLNADSTSSLNAGTWVWFAIKGAST